MLNVTRLCPGPTSKIIYIRCMTPLPPVSIPFTSLLPPHYTLNVPLCSPLPRIHLHFSYGSLVSTTDPFVSVTQLRSYLQRNSPAVVIAQTPLFVSGRCFSWSYCIGRKVLPQFTFAQCMPLTTLVVLSYLQHFILTTSWVLRVPIFKFINSSSL